MNPALGLALVTLCISLHALPPTAQDDIVPTSRLSAAIFLGYEFHGPGPGLADMLDVPLTTRGRSFFLGAGMTLVRPPG